MSGVLLEACVDTVASAVEAERAGAGRLELCGWLADGGTTPDRATMREVRAAVRIPLFALIRPRGGDFVYGDGEMAVMHREIAAAKELGFDGVVLGVLGAQGEVDRERTGELAAVARPMGVTFHRAFDLTPDPLMALEVLVGLKIDRVLTSGQAATAAEGIPLLRNLVQRGAGRITILAGGGIRGGNAAEIVRATGVREVHARTSEEPTVAAGIVQALRTVR